MPSERLRASLLQARVESGTQSQAASWTWRLCRIWSRRQRELSEAETVRVPAAAFCRSPGTIRQRHLSTDVVLLLECVYAAISDDGPPRLHHHANVKPCVIPSDDASVQLRERRARISPPCMRWRQRHSFPLPSASGKTTFKLKMAPTSLREILTASPR